MDEVLGRPQGEAVGNIKGRLERAVFETDQHLVEGDMTLPPAGYQSRFSDWLNRDKSDFLPLTDATITALDNGKVSELPFVVLSKRHIRVAYPSDA